MEWTLNNLTRITTVSLLRRRVQFSDIMINHISIVFRHFSRDLAGSISWCVDDNPVVCWIQLINRVSGRLLVPFPSTNPCMTTLLNPSRRITWTKNLKVIFLSIVQVYFFALFSVLLILMLDRCAIHTILSIRL